MKNNRSNPSGSLNSLSLAPASSHGLKNDNGNLESNNLVRCEAAADSFDNEEENNSHLSFGVSPSEIN